MKKIAIAGGGISGLSLAYYLQKYSRETNQSVEVHLFDPSSKFGGVIETLRTQDQIVEQGPDAFLSEKPEAAELARDLGIEGDIISTESANRRSFIGYRGRLSPVPPGFYLVAPTTREAFFKTPVLNPFEKIRAALELITPASKNTSDESLGAFISRRFGSGLSRKIAQPMVGGIYGADINRLSLQATFPQWQQWEREHGSMIRGMIKKRSKVKTASGPRYSLFLSFRTGMSQLIDALRSRLDLVEPHLGQKVLEVRRDKARWKIEIDHGSMECDAVALAVQPRESSRILRLADAQLSQILAGINYGSMTVINLEYQSAKLKDQYLGFGFVDADENSPFMGVSYSSHKFAGRSPRLLIRAFVGDRGNHFVVNKSDQEIVKIVHERMKAYLTADEQPCQSWIKRWPASMPLYEIGHKDRVQQIMDLVKNHPGLYLTGNGYSGIGIPDCIRQSKQTAAQMVKDFK